MATKKTTNKKIKASKNKKPTRREQLENVSMRATRSLGSIESLGVHTVLFAVCFASVLFGASLDRVLLVLTTVLSLEAIYLAIFIQMSVNQNTLQLLEVERDLEDLSEDIEEISEDIEGIEKDIEEIQEDIEEIHEDFDAKQGKLELEKKTKKKPDTILNS
jgi:peptidoglycan hydrolase CwlO-like protein